MKKYLALVFLLSAVAYGAVTVIQDPVNPDRRMKVNSDGSINTSGSGSGGVQYLDGDVDAQPTGTVAMGKDPSDVLKALGLSAAGNLNVNLAEGSITGGNAAASPTGAAVPASAGYTGYSSGGNLVGVSTGTPLPVAQQGSVAVTGTFFQATQPVSGTFFQATQPVSGPFLTDTQLRAAPVPVSGTFFQATQPVSGPLTDTQLRATAVPVSGSLGRTWALSSGTDSVGSVQSGTWNLTNISGTISLPTGASTAAKQDTGNTSLASIDGKITTDAQGIKTSVSNRVMTVSGSGVAVDDTPIASTDVTGFSTADVEVKCSGFGTVTETAVFEGSNDNSVWYPLFPTGATVLKTPQEIESHSVYVVSGNACADNQIYHVRFVGKYFRMRIDFQDGAGQTIAAVAKINTLDVADPLPVTKTSLQDYYGIQFLAGQQNMGNSFPVVIASDQTALPVSGTFFQATQPVSGSLGRTWTLSSGTDSVASAQSGTWNLTNISGTISLPTGASTSALQTTGNTSLSSIDGKTPAFGQAAMVASVPVAIASNQSAIPVTQSGSWPLSAGSAIVGKVGIDQTTPGTTNGVQVNAALPAGANAIGKLATNSGVTIGAVEIAAAQTLGTVTTVGTVSAVTAISNALPAGAAILGKVGIDQTTPGTTNGVQVNAALPTGANAIGKLATNSGVTIGAVEIAAAQTLGTVSTVTAVTAITNALPAGSNAIGKLAANGGVTIGDVNVISEIPGTGATNLGKAEDAAHTTADVGVMALGVRVDPTTTARTSADADYSGIAVDHVGAVAIAAHPGRYSCFVALTATVTTQCQAAPGAGLRNYVTSLSCSNGAASVQGVDVVFGTGAACVTGTTALTHKYQMGTNALTTSPFVVSVNYGDIAPLVPTAANAICVRPTAATAFGCTITGFIAP